MNLTYKDQTYPLKAGMGFVKDISALSTQEIQGVQVEVGLESYVIKLQALRDPVALADVLDLLNKYAGGARLTKRDLYEYLEDDSTDIDALIDEVVDFLSKANVCKAKLKGILNLNKPEEVLKA